MVLRKVSQVQRIEITVIDDTQRDLKIRVIARANAESPMPRGGSESSVMA